MRTIDRTPIDTAQTAEMSLRPRTGSDQSFLFALYTDARDDAWSFGWSWDEVRQFLDMQFRAREYSFGISHPAAQSDIVEVDGRAVGRLLVDRRPHEIQLVDVALLSEHRGMGIGTRLITGLIEEAVLAERPICLQVQRDSRALDLYERLGFVGVTESGAVDPSAMYITMEYRAS
jgi:ribosomal protein S18 acetylase RimI-like enzyme